MTAVKVVPLMMDKDEWFSFTIKKNRARKMGTKEWQKVRRVHMNDERTTIFQQIHYSKIICTKVSREIDFKIRHFSYFDILIVIELGTE